MKGFGALETRYQFGSCSFMQHNFMHVLIGKDCTKKKKEKSVECYSMASNG